MNTNDQNISHTGQLLPDIPATDISNHRNIFSNNQTNDHNLPISQINNPNGKYYSNNNSNNNSCSPLSFITKSYDSNDSGQGTQTLTYIECHSAENYYSNNYSNNIPTNNHPHIYQSIQINIIQTIIIRIPNLQQIILKALIIQMISLSITHLYRVLLLHTIIIQTIIIRVPYP